ncbi:MAG: SHOCT domain-containing protein [Maritimibacter sp.]|nr:SHOCT domain-containing protein [Maritimibacter sp.]
MGWGGGYGMFGGFMMLVFWGVVIALIVVAVRWYGPQSLRQGSASSALDILEARFATGEIDEDEFQKRRAALES